MNAKLSFPYWAIIGFFFCSFIFCTPVSAFADVCASDVTGSSAYGGAFGPYDGNDYGIPFTVAAPCDVTSIKIEVETHGGGTGTGNGFIIWDNIHNEILDGSAESTGASCNLEESTVASGSGTLYPGNTYYVGERGDIGPPTTQFCGLSDGTSNVPSYFSGGVWNTWVVNGVHFEIDGNAAPPAPPTSSVASSTDSYSQSQENLFHSLILFLMGFVIMVWLVRKH